LARQAARLTVRVVLPTPPFILTVAMTSPMIYLKWLPDFSTRYGRDPEVPLHMIIGFDRLAIEFR
jgi:hypothetical protein